MYNSKTLPEIVSRYGALSDAPMSYDAIVHTMGDEYKLDSSYHRMKALRGVPTKLTISEKFGNVDRPVRAINVDFLRFRSYTDGIFR